MKLSSNTVGILVITAIATAAFVWMAKRPAVEGNALKFGMPAEVSTTTPTPKTIPQVTDEKVIEPVKVEAPSEPTETSSQDKVTEPAEASSQAEITQEEAPAAPEETSPATEEAPTSTIESPAN